MKTKAIPAIVMLLAGAVVCVVGIVYKYETIHFVTMLLAALIIFYILGCVVKIILDKNFSEMATEPEEQTELTDEVKENIESESDEENNE